MDFDLQTLESDLRSLRPTPLDATLLDRLSNAATGTLEDLNSDARVTEARLSKGQPSALSDNLTKRLEAIVADVPFAVDEKVVLFPRGAETSKKPAARKSKGPWYAAAAAVALAGGLAALMVNPDVAKSPTAGQMPAQPAPVATSPGAFMPASFDSGVSDTDDLGLVWSQTREPMRLVRVVYRDKVVFVNQKGDRIEREVPRVEYLMVKEKID